MIAKPQSVGVNQVLEKIYDPRSVCPFVVRPKILNFLIWIGSPTSMSTTVSLKKRLHASHLYIFRATVGLKKIWTNFFF